MLDGQVRGIEDFIAIEIRDRHLGRRDEEEVALLDPKGVLLKLRKLAGSRHRGTIYELRRHDFGVAVLADMQIHHEVDERALEPRSGSLQEDEARPGDLDRALEVDDAEPLGHFVVRPHLEAVRFAALDAPGADRHVAGGIFPFRHQGVRRVGDFEKQRVEPGSDRRNSLLQGLDLIPQEA